MFLDPPLYWLHLFDLYDSLLEAGQSALTAYQHAHETTSVNENSTSRRKQTLVTETQLRCQLPGDNENKCAGVCYYICLLQ